jgi:hypothetical protein
MKAIYTRSAPMVGIKAIVYQFDAADPELCVKLWRNGQYCYGAEYYTECIDDAIGTIDAMIQRFNQLGEF